MIDYKRILDKAEDEIVIADLEHKIIYANETAVNYHISRGRGNIVGKSLLDFHNSVSCEKIKSFVNKLVSENLDEMEMYFHPKRKKYTYIVSVRDEKGNIVGYYEIFRNEQR